MPADAGSPTADDIERPSRHSWFRTQAAPLPIGQASIVYGLLAVPAVAWAIADWPVYLLFVAMLPSTVLATQWGKRQARRDGAARRSVSADAKIGAVVGALGGATAGVTVSLGGERYLGLLALVFALAVEPWLRRAYRRRRHTG